MDRKAVRRSAPVTGADWPATILFAVTPSSASAERMQERKATAPRARTGSLRSDPVARRQAGTPPVKPGERRVYAKVDHIRASMETALQLRASTVVPVGAISGVGSITLLRDPVGNIIGLISDEGT